MFTYFNGDEDSTLIFKAEDFTLASEVASIDIQTKKTVFTFQYN